MAAGPAGQLPDFGQMRCSTADRERAIDVLKAAFAEGRLDMDEYADRVGQAHTSRTYGELAAITADLPVGPLGTMPAALAASVPAPDAPAALPAIPAVPATPVARPVSGQTSGLAFFALMFGLLAVVLPVGVAAGALGVPAMLAGLLALPATGQRGKRGRWMAVAAMVLGLIAATRT